MKIIPGVIPHEILTSAHKSMGFDEAQERGDRIAQRHGAKLQRLLVEAQELVAGAAGLRQRARHMTKITDDIASMVASEAVCKRGCHHCCKQSVTISAWEARRIGGVIGRNPANVEGIDTTVDTEGERRRFSGVPCPFLHDGECSVYHVRPLACRTQFNLARDPGLCDIVGNPGAEVPNFNFSPLWLMQVQMFIGAGEKMADIRDFFPGGEGKPGGPSE